MLIPISKQNLLFKAGIAAALCSALVLGIWGIVDFSMVSLYFFYNTYYFIAIITVLWLLSIIIHLRQESFSLTAFLKRNAAPLILPWLATFLIVWTIKPYYNVTSGEMLGLTTSKYMASERSIRTVDAVFPGEESSIQVNFRPALFPFLVSLLHQFGGYRAAHAFEINYLVLGILLSTVFLITRRFNDIFTALITLLLIVGNPLIPITACSAGFDLLSVLLIGLDLIFLYRFMQKPETTRFALLWSTLLMTAHIREESTMYLFIFGAGLWLSGYRKLDNTAKLLLAMTPLLISPAIWLRFFNHMTYSGQPLASVFNWDICKFNWNEFLANQLKPDSGLPYNTLLHWVAFFCWVWFFANVFLRRNQLKEPFQKHYILIAATCFLAYHFLLFGWSWLHPYTSQASARLFIPFVLICSLAPVVILAGKPRWSKGFKIALFIFAVYSLLTHYPMAIRGDFIRNHIMNRDADYFREFLKRDGRRNLLVIAYRQILTADLDLKAASLYQARKNHQYLNTIIQNHEYSDIIVMQHIEPKTKVPVISEKFDDYYILETLDTRIIAPPNIACRISRIKGIKASGTKSPGQTKL